MEGAEAAGPAAGNAHLITAQGRFTIYDAGAVGQRPVHQVQFGVELFFHDAAGGRDFAQIGRNIHGQAVRLGLPGEGRADEGVQPLALPFEGSGCAQDGVECAARVNVLNEGYEGIHRDAVTYTGGIIPRS